MRRRSAVLATVATMLLLALTPAVSTAAAGAGQAEDQGGDGRSSSVDLSWKLSPTGSTARLRGLAPVSRRTAWVSGSEGTVLRTTDGGRSWASVGPPGTQALQFRDIEATSADHAVILSIGEGGDSRIYVTDDGGRSWTESFRNAEPSAFYDCMAFTSPTRGLAMSDPVDGTFRLVETADGGHTWKVLDPAGMPPARPGEFGFAASGTCLTAGEGSSMYLASGGTHPGRVFTSHDRGQTWKVADTPIAGGPAAGVFSVQFRDQKRGIAVGGDYLNPTGAQDNAAYSSDGGRTWQAPTSFPAGYRSGSAWVPFLRSVALAVGPSGSDISRDSGRSWHALDSGSFDSVECTVDGSCWASGEQGRVATARVSDRH